MSEERRNHQKIRRNADRVRARLAATLAESRGAAARDKRTAARAGERDSVEPLGGERGVARYGKSRAPEAGAEPGRDQDAER